MSKSLEHELTIPTTITFLLGQDEHGREITLQRHLAANRETTWTIRRAAYNQRDDSPVIAGIPDAVMRRIVNTIVEPVAAPYRWRTVASDGYPACDGHTTYVGINSAGYACCFNEMRNGLCVMSTAEGDYRQMSDLRDWRLLDRAARSDGACEGEKG